MNKKKKEKEKKSYILDILVHWSHRCIDKWSYFHLEHKFHH